MSTIAENIASVRVRMAEAARAAGRSPQEILLCGASKMNDAAACREAISAGIDCLGENRVQEMVQKRSEHAYVGAPLHFIGVLQKNKVRQVVGQVDLIHSVDSMGLLDEIDKRAAMNGLTQNILLEVNIGGEDSKSGFRPEEVESAIKAVLARPERHVRIQGLMAILPFHGDEQRLCRCHCCRFHHGPRGHRHFRRAPLRRPCRKFIIKRRLCYGIVR